MKFSIAVILTNVLLVSSVLAMPLSQDVVSSNSTEISPKASITISKPSVNPPPSVTLADTMSGSTAIASITLQGHDATAQSVSGSESIFRSPSAAALSLAIVTALITL
ncbi:unnamed protein product [Mucor hiemalis]